MREKFAQKSTHFLSNLLSMFPICLVVGALLQIYVIEADVHARPFIDYSRWICNTCGEVNSSDTEYCSYCGLHKDKKPTKEEPDGPFRSWDDEEPEW